MVAIPKAEYELSKQTDRMDPMVEAERVNALVQLEQSCFHNLAEGIVHDKPTVSNMNNCTVRLAMFDNIRRRYFGITTRDKGDELKK